MGKYTATQNNFSSGELGPTLQGRTDIQEYANGASEILNFIPLKDGGITRRPATKSLVADQDSFDAASGTLHTFTSDIQEDIFISLKLDYSFPDALGTLEARYYVPKLDGAHPTNGNSLQSIVLDPYEVTVNVSDRFKQLIKDYRNDDDVDFRVFNQIQVFESIILTHPSGKFPPLIIIRKTDDPNDLTPRVEIHEYLPFSATQTTEGRSVVFPVYNVSGTNSLSITDVGGELTLLLGGDYQLSAFKDRKIGDYVKVLISAGEERIYRITGLTVAGEFKVTPIVGSGANVGGTNNWVMGSWSDYSGFPRACSIYQQRIAFGGTRVEPATIWFGNVENLYLLLLDKLAQDQSGEVSGLDFFGADLASDPFSVTIASNITTAITWMEADRVLQVGTKNVEYAVATVDGQFDRSRAQVSAQTFYGSRGGTTTRVLNEVLFASRDGKEMRANRFSFESGGNTSRLLSVLSREMIFHELDPVVDSSRYKAAFIKSVYQNTRGCVWMITSQGSLVGLILEESSKTLAWHRHNVGGKVVGMTVLPSPDGNSDMLILNVERLQSGQTKHTLVILLDSYHYDNISGEAEESMHLDNYVEKTPDASGIISGLNEWGFWNGKDVTVWRDGIEIGTYVVQVGSGAKTSGVLQDLSFEAILNGASLNGNQIVYIDGGTAGAEVVTGGGGTYVVTLEDGVSTATQVKAALDAYVPFSSLFTTTISGTAGTAQVSGLVVMANGVGEGFIKTSLDSTKICAVGFSYKSRVSSMLIKSGSKTGDAQIQQGRVDSLSVNSIDSKHFKIGTSDAGLESVDLTDEGAVELFTGITKRSVSSSGGREEIFIIETEKSYPLTILSVGVRGDTQD